MIVSHNLFQKAAEETHVSVLKILQKMYVSYDH